MRQNKVGSKVGASLSTLVLVMAVIMFVTVIVQVSSSGYVQVGGYSLFRIVTGSMGDTIPVGTLLLCKSTEIEDIERGDIICFRSYNPQIFGQVVTHRVVNVIEGDDGQVVLETRGDANPSADIEKVTASNLIGRVQSYKKDDSIMVLLVDVLTDKIGFLILIMFPTLLVAGFILRSCIKNMRKEIDKALEAEKHQHLYTDEEYADMLQRIREEVAEEIKDLVGENNAEETGDSKTE